MRAPSRMTARRALVLTTLVLLCACQEKDPKRVDSVRPVLFTEAKPIRTETFGPFAASIEPRYQTQLGFRTAGRVVTRHAAVGDLVRRGDLLASLDPSILHFALRQAQADVKNAAGQLKNSAAAEARKRVLLRADAAPQAMLDEAVSDRGSAAARLEQARARLTRAEDQLGYAELRAEFDGVVTAWRAEIGQVVTEGTTVVTMARPDLREAVVDVPDDLVGNIRPGLVFTVALQASMDITASARPREIAPGADAQTRTRRVRLMLEAPSDAFRLGSTAIASFASPVPEHFEIPASALLERDGRTSVWTVSPQTRAVTQRDVAVSKRDDRTATVTSGLAEGDRVVTAGVNRLREGQIVKMPAAAESAKALAFKVPVREGSP